MQIANVLVFEHIGVRRTVGEVRWRIDGLKDLRNRDPVCRPGKNVATARRTGVSTPM